MDGFEYGKFVSGPVPFIPPQTNPHATRFFRSLLLRGNSCFFLDAIAHYCMLPWPSTSKTIDAIPMPSVCQTEANTMCRSQDYSLYKDIHLYR